MLTLLDGTYDDTGDFDLMRVGRFWIPDIFIFQTPSVIAKAFAKMRFLPRGVSRDVRLNATSYIGVSPMFDALEQGQVIPEYVITVGPLADTADVSVEVNRRIGNGE